MMQDPVTHRLNPLLNFLQKQNLTFLSQSHPSSIALNLCKWCALILALLATFRTILVIRFRQNAPSLPSIPLLFDDDDDDYSDDEDDVVSCSSPSTSSEFEDDDDDEEEKEENRTGEFFRVRGSGNGDGGFLRGRSIGDLFSLSEIANSKSVVKLWETIGFGLEFGFDDSGSSDDRSVVSVYGSNDEDSSSPAVVVSAGENASGNLALRIWDSRLRRRIPAVIAEWGPGFGKTVGVESGGVQKVYVRDNGRYGLTVGDMRNVRLPLEDVTESHLDLWWPNSYSYMLKI